ncbi:hypothetical protein [Rosistilla oblonga]|uniref:Uncharacterized protein n=1 Tax=Rosistilla oblonga TaxID=2527990 RepID=A0A518IPM7_9BACT|nr:hypothetical protein [Rosistilla oblonga]QDV55056.1 hypothetical protein Mal33_10240 [Rosistilla oblonga]
MTNPITDQIRELRHRLAADFDNDLDRIYADLQRKEKASGRVVIDLRGERVATDCQAMQQSGGGKLSPADHKSPPLGER